MPVTTGCLTAQTLGVLYRQRQALHSKVRRLAGNPRDISQSLGRRSPHRPASYVLSHSKPSTCTIISSLSSTAAHPVQGLRLAKQLQHKFRYWPPTCLRRLRGQNRPFNDWRRLHIQSFSGPKNNGFGSGTPFIAIAFIFGVILICNAPPKAANLYSELRTCLAENNLDPQSTEIEDWGEMTQEALPGRPGKLTAEQDEKLRELWTATFHVFGVFDEQHPKELNGNVQTDASHQLHQGVDHTTDKPKKKKSLFGRKNKDTDTDSVASGDSGTEGDKYGQTKQYHEALATQSPQNIRATFWSMVKHDHPDALLLRFLRARKWDVEKALIMMVSTMNWRATEMHVDDDIMKSGEGGALASSLGTKEAEKRLGEDFLAQMRLGKSFLHGLDKSGRPMCIVRVRLHKQGDQIEESLERYTVFIIESARMILAPPIDTACIVFDMTGFSLANMDYAPVKFMIKCFEANYPESLGVVLVHKAPGCFKVRGQELLMQLANLSSGIWKIIKGWLDPVVASKVKFTNSVEDMQQYVDRSRIMKELGGDEDWSYKYTESKVDENLKMKDTETRDKLLAERQGIVSEFEKSTMDWIDQKSGDLSEIKKKRLQLADQLREDYWKLDPYIRARTLYDRWGILQPGGRLDFYPNATAPTASPPVKTTNGAQEARKTADDVD